MGPSMKGRFTNNALVSERDKIIVVNPAHGNEPYILGSAIADAVRDRLADRGIKDVKILIPLLYGDRQEGILREEHRGNLSHIYLDGDFGGILKDILFKDGDFASHLSVLNSNYNEVNCRVTERFLPGNQIQVRSLETGEPLIFNTEDIIATVDTAGRVLIPAPKRYFAFPELLSEIL
ncbi:MAG: hypothetical protein KGH67_06010, partial [Candidatus Micrarchaeota archaeon]|nr:hypothetical protein [Candidatus Micrarchaeota archaeon]